MKRPTRPTYARELCVTYRIREPRVVVDTKQIRTAADAAAVLVPLLEPQAQELFLCLHLDNSKRLIGVQEVGRGSTSEVVVSVRTIFTAALGASNSTALILGHNHLSTSCDPSPADLVLTQRIVEAGKLFEIEICDHLVVANGCFLSLRESGRMRRM